jgi:hypothetical protein
MYRALDADKIIETARVLGSRISERFPGCSLSKVANELLAEARQAATTEKWLAAPLLWVRVVAVAGILLMLVVTGATLLVMNRKVELFSSIAEFFQGLDAAVNEIILLGVAIYFLVGLEKRLKRRRAIKAIHVLRSMAHIIDMHQLTKDPDRLAQARSDTPSSPSRHMTPFELTRYLDYCSEMLAIISKVAALYVQNFTDSITVSAVNEVEDLTNGLSRKVWQKIMILDRMMSPK